MSIPATQSPCTLCPRLCGARRDSGELGFCAMTDQLLVARAALHQWEEPCLSGERGSGTVFFVGCTLRCCYCQNREISRGKAGKVITVQELAQIFLKLQAQGAHNINLVTPTHYIPQIITALRLAKAHGLTLPIVYNTGGYERVESLRLLRGLVDVYLPDFKYHSDTLAKRFSNAPDYGDTAQAAIAEMLAQTGPARFDAAGMMTGGVLVRHLVLPDCTEDSKAVLKRLWEHFGNDIYISIMNQYTPMPQVPPQLSRPITDAEYQEVVDYAIALGIEQGFIQEGGTVSESFIPDFQALEL